MDKNKLLDELTEALGNNRGLAERTLKLFDYHGLDKHIEEWGEDIAEMDEEEKREHFCNLAYDWEIEPNSDSTCFLIDILTALHYDYERCCGRGHLADLMVIYYRNSD